MAEAPLPWLVVFVRKKEEREYDKCFNNIKTIIG